MERNAQFADSKSQREGTLAFNFCESLTEPNERKKQTKYIVKSECMPQPLNLIRAKWISLIDW